MWAIEVDHVDDRSRPPGADWTYFSLPAVGHGEEPTMFGTIRDRTGSGGGDLLLDRHLPRFDETVNRHAVVEAPVDETHAAALSADFTRTGPVERPHDEIRALPMRIAAAFGGGVQSRTTDALRLADLPERGIWVRLGESPGEEFVFGAVGAVWQPEIEWVETDADSFREFDRPGYAKISAGISVRPYGSGRTLVTYEARTTATDAASRRRFRWYWRLVGPGAGYLMSRALARIAADAEAPRGRRDGS